jgi:anti-sigma regulatory factor (Ser/Thr protein kinase)
MHPEATDITEPLMFRRSYPGAKEQVRQVRADLAAIAAGCPLADDLVLLGSELVTNAIMHSKSGQPGGEFTVRAQVRPGSYAWLEVEDQGGPWIEHEADEEHGHGLDLVKALAGGKWDIEPGKAPGTRTVWVWLDWPGES